MSFVSVPVTYSKPRDFALPICDTLVPTVTISVPLALVASLYKFTFLIYGFKITLTLYPKNKWLI